MRRVLICTGVLGSGSALTFAFAALAASLAPPGPLLYGQYGQPWAMDLARPMRVPAQVWDSSGPRIVFDESGSSGWVEVAPTPDVAPAP